MLTSDLDSLFKLVVTCRKPVREGDVRLASVVLRKWLIEGLLGNLTRRAGVKPTFYADDNSIVCEELVDHSSINYFLTGGICFDGQPVSCIYHANIPSSGAPLLSVDTVKQREFGFAAFLKQKRVYFEGEFFSCEDIIKYIANKVGGAHLDFDRPGLFQKMEKAAAFMKYGGPGVPVGSDPPSEIYLVLEPRSHEIVTGFHIEIIAAAASFIQVHFDGKPFLNLERRRSLRSRLREWLGVNTQRRHVIYDY